MNQLLERRAFLEWLRSLPPEHALGVPGDPTGCPISAYLRAQGAQYAFIGRDMWTVKLQDKSTQFTPPAWGALFLEWIDSQDSETPIDAAAALSFLSGAPAATPAAPRP